MHPHQHPSGTNQASRHFFRSGHDPGWTQNPSPNISAFRPTRYHDEDDFAEDGNESTVTYTEPTAEYIRVSLTPSTSLKSPSPSRKLLILDLNGTLLLRSPHPDEAQQNEESVADHRTRITPLPHRRHVYPRPYLAAFREYLFTPSNRAWLDTMVWSSAKPRNVNDMLHKCFGNNKRMLVAVWARDTFGLTSAEYNRKTPTTKDLNKPWSQLRLLPPSLHLNQPTSSRHSSHDDPAPNLQVHSAMTTILLDDSPWKAQCQPWNHLCVPEYVKDTRANDLQVWEKEKNGRINQERKGDLIEGCSVDNKGRMEKKENGGELAGDTSVPAREVEARPVTSSPPLVSRALDTAEPGRYDETLLAVVGILDAIKAESNVAGWIRAGGLWARGIEGYDGGITFSENDADRDAALAYPLSPPASSSSASLVAVDIERPPMVWFEHPPLVEYWVGQGRKALKALGIEANAGVTD